MATVMMKNGFEGGTNGGNVSVANSGGLSGDGFDTIVVNNSPVNAGSSAFVYSSAAATKGALGVAMAVGPNNYLRMTQAAPAGMRCGASMKFKFDGNPTAIKPILQIRSASAAVGYLTVTQTGKIVPQGSNAVGITNGNSTTTLVAGNTYRVTVMFTVGTTTTDGIIQYRIYDAADVMLEEKTFTGQNTGTLTPTTVRFYSLDTSPVTPMLADEFSFATSDELTSWIGLPVDTAPTLVVETQSPVCLIESEGTGIAVTYAIVQLTGPTKTVHQIGPGIWAVPNDAAQDTTWRVTVTQNDGQYVNKTVTVPFISSTSSNVNRLVRVGGTWT